LALTLIYGKRKPAPEPPNGGTKRNELTEENDVSLMLKAALKVCQARLFPGALAMPKNSIKTSNCQYASNGKTCGRPPHFLHIKSGKVFCWNHYSKLSIVTSGWVNLQRPA